MRNGKKEWNWNWDVFFIIMMVALLAVVIVNCIYKSEKQTDAYVNDVPKEADEALNYNPTAVKEAIDASKNRSDLEKLRDDLADQKRRLNAVIPESDQDPDPTSEKSALKELRDHLIDQKRRLNDEHYDPLIPEEQNWLKP